jgi:hypothetical protein
MDPTSLGKEKKYTTSGISSPRAATYISTQQDALLCFANVKKRNCPFQLLLLSMDIKAIRLNISQ